ncbi:MAG: HAMP domain-containing histidine kinase [Actinobacteria bacterium]|nr:HAMP domain-containing histidine kinase [Actinomycetota bacterium]
MPGSLRFRLSALFLLAIAIAGLLAAAIALRLFQGYTRDQSFEVLTREARGLTTLYRVAALRAAEEGKDAPDFVPANLEAATGDRIFYLGAPLFPGQESGLTILPESAVPAEVATLERTMTFEFTPPGEDRSFLAASNPVRLELEAAPIGAMIVAQPANDLRDQWLPLVGRLALAFVVGAALAGGLAIWLSRRLTTPVLALSRGVDEIAAGNYAVRVSDGRGADEITKLSQRFNEMAARLAATEERERQFLMSVSHELRTPLTGIRGYVDALRDGLIDDPELVHASLDVVAAEAVRLERLVGDVLDLAKLRAHRFTVQTEEVDLERLVAQAYGAFADEARRRSIDYRLVQRSELPTIVTDGDRVLQIVTNLLKNAFRWTPDGGAIELDVARSAGDVVIEVADDGPGISEEVRERIFSPFVSADTQGTGLGLAIARELARALGGAIELASDNGSGSRFRIVLPAERRARPPEETRAPPVDAGRRGGR